MTEKQTIEQLKFMVDSLANAHPGVGVHFIYPSPTPKRDERTLTGHFAGYRVRLSQSGLTNWIEINIVKRY